MSLPSKTRTSSGAGRVPHWDLELATALGTALTCSFRWGISDCAIWAASVAARLRGDPAILAPFREAKYADARGASRALRQAGFGSLEAATSHYLGEPLPGPTFAGRGDIVMSAEGALGVCLGKDAAFLSTEGLVQRPLSACIMAWRV